MSTYHPTDYKPHQAAPHRASSSADPTSEATSPFPPLAESRPWEEPGVKHEFVDDIPKFLGRAPDAEIWTLYNEKAKEWDKETVDGWTAGMDTLLIFAALFSAIVTAFLVLSLGLLQPDNSQATVDVLMAISAQLSATHRNAASEPSAYQASDSFIPPRSAVWINALWIVSLTISLFTSVLAMLVKQWLNVYTSKLSSVPLRRARERHFRYMGLTAWNVPAIVDSLPLFLHLAVLAFFVGFPLYLWTVHLVLAQVMTGIWATGGLAYICLAFAPLVWVNCPYKSPLTLALHPCAAIFNSGRRNVRKAGIRFQGMFKSRPSAESNSREQFRYDNPPRRGNTIQRMYETVGRDLQSLGRTMHAHLCELSHVPGQLRFWLQIGMNGWEEANLDLVDTDAFGWLETVCQTPDEKETIVCAFFGWKPHHQPWQKIETPMWSASWVGIRRLTQMTDGGAMELHTEPTATEAHQWMVKFAAFATFNHQFLPYFAPTWYNEPWARRHLHGSANDGNKLLQLVVALWCCGTEQWLWTPHIFTDFHSAAIAEFASGVQRRPSRMSRFGTWLLIEHSRLMLEQSYHFVELKKAQDAIRNNLLPAVHELVARSTNLPDLLVDSIYRLWLAVGRSREEIADMELAIPGNMPILNTHPEAQIPWHEVLERRSPAEMTLAARSYVVHNVKAEGMRYLSPRKFLGSVILRFKQENLLYPERKRKQSLSEDLEVRHQVDLRVAYACSMALMDQGYPHLIPLDALQLLARDSIALSTLFNHSDEKRRTRLYKHCGNILKSETGSKQLHDIIACVQEQQDAPMTWLVVLLVWAAFRGHDPDELDHRQIIERVLNTAWLEMLCVFGYTEVVRNNLNLCAAMAEVLGHLAGMRKLAMNEQPELARVCALLDIIAEHPWDRMDDEITALLEQRDTWQTVSSDIPNATTIYVPPPVAHGPVSGTTRTQVVTAPRPFGKRKSLPWSAGPQPSRIEPPTTAFSALEEGLCASVALDAIQATGGADVLNTSTNVYGISPCHAA